jgi:putative peptide maturation system protein
VPWPLRGVQRWTDRELLRVNTTAMRVDQAIACLDFIWDDRRIIDRLVNACLIQDALAREPIELSDEELQQAMDGFRRARRLYTAEETRRWLARRGMTHEQLEEYVGDTALVARLRRRVTDGRVDAYFTANRERFDAAAVARIDFATAADARRAGDRARGGQTDFYALAEQRFREGTQPAGQPGQPARELFALIRRGQAAEPLAAAVFAAAPGDVIGPVPWDGGHSLLRVLEFAPARLDEPTRREIERLLFDEWLEDRRRAATIEWNWGSAARTGDG